VAASTNLGIVGCRRAVKNLTTLVVVPQLARMVPIDSDKSFLQATRNIVLKIEESEGVFGCCFFRRGSTKYGCCCVVGAVDVFDARSVDRLLVMRKLRRLWRPPEVRGQRTSSLSTSLSLSTSFPNKMDNIYPCSTSKGTLSQSKAHRDGLNQGETLVLGCRDYKLRVTE